MSRRIFMCGPAGTGKTTLAKILSETYELGKFLEGSSKVIWDKHNIKKHHDIIEASIFSPKWGLEFQNELLDYRMALLDNNPGNIVSDRSPLDNVVYFLLQNSTYCSEDETRTYIDKALGSFKEGDWVIMRYYPAWYIANFLQIENDGSRITNIYYQKLVQELVEARLEDIQKRGVNVYKMPISSNFDALREDTDKLVTLIRKNG